MNNIADYLTRPITDPVMIFAIIMVVVLVVPTLFTRLRLPGMVGLIVAGAVLGPHATGLLVREGLIESLGRVGLLFLMFTAGISLDLAQFNKLRHQSLNFGLLSFLVPALGALAVAMPFAGYGLPAALLLAAIVGSHTLLAYPIAKRLGITSNTAMTMTTGGTIVTDTMALTLLAVVLATTAGETGLLFWLQFFGMLAAYVAIAVVGLPRLGRWFFRNVESKANIEFVFMTAVLFVTAAAAYFVGLAPIVGAFLAGLVMNRLIPESSTLMSRIHFVADALFVPFFLISVGMLVDPRVLTRAEVWAHAAMFTGLVVFGKLIAAKAIQWIYRYTPEEGWAIFGLSVPQAAATLAVTLVGYRVGLFDGTAVNAVVIMILVTCLLGPWLVERYGRRIAEREEIFEPRDAEAPQRILVPLSNPATADALVDLACILRDPNLGEPINAITVVPDDANAVRAVAAGEKMLSHAVIHAAAANVPVRPVTRIDMNIANGIARAIRERRASEIIIGWNGQVRASQRVFGSVLDQLLQQTQQMVLVSKIERPVNMTDRIVLVLPPFVGREVGFDVAIHAVKMIARETGAKLAAVVTEQRMPRVKARMESIRPDVPTSFQAIGDWWSMMAALESTVAEDDMIILMSVREGRLAWQPDLDRLPRRIAHRFPQTNFLTLYPSEVTVETPSPLPLAQFPDLLRPENVSLHIPQIPFEQAVSAMVERALGDRAGAEQLSKQLQEAAREYPMEVTPGVTLLHTLTDRVRESTLLLGIAPEGLDLPRIGNLTHVVFVLLSPVTLLPERHLRALAEVAMMVRSSKTVNSLREAESIQELGEILREEMRRG